MVAMTDDKKPWEKVIWPEPKTGGENITGTGATILDYWRWADSDLVANSSRGVLAEFLVAKIALQENPHT